MQHFRKLGEHVREALSYLDELGATDVAISKSKHLRIQWKQAGRDCHINMSATPSNRGDCANIARQLIRRELRRIA